MPPKRLIEHTVYIIDCKPPVEEKLDQFYSIYACRVFHRYTKIKPIDEQKVILTNTPINNSVETVVDWSRYNITNLKTVRDACIAPSDEDEKPHNHNNLLKAINQASLTMDDIIDTKNIINRKIVVFTDLLAPINKREDHIQKLKLILKESKAYVYIIGVDCASPSITSNQDIKKLFNLDYLVKSDNPVLQDNLSIIRQLSCENIAVLSYAQGFHVYFAHWPQIKDPYPWYANISIGTDVRIPVMTHRTKRNRFPITLKYMPLEPGATIIPDKVFFDVNTHEEVPWEDVVRGYSFHGKFATFTPEQEAEMKALVKTNKGLSILGFVDADQFKLNLYCMRNTRHKVKPDRRSPRGDVRAFRLFATALRAKNVIALCTRVYNNGNKPHLFAMFPCPERQTNNYLMMCQIPYNHQYIDRYYRGPDCKLEQSPPKVRQNVYDFLDSMVGDNHVVPVGENVKFDMNLARQFMVIAKRSLGEDPGPAPLVTVHPELVERCHDYAENLVEYIEVPEDDEDE